MLFAWDSRQNYLIVKSIPFYVVDFNESAFAKKKILSEIRICKINGCKFLGFTERFQELTMYIHVCIWMYIAYSTKQYAKHF